MMNYTQKNRGMGFALCLCNTKAKLAIKCKDKTNTTRSNDMNLSIRKLTIELLDDWLFYFDKDAFSDDVLFVEKFFE